MNMTTGERIRRDRERRECIGWAIACIAVGALCIYMMVLRDAMKDVRVTTEVRR